MAAVPGAAPLRAPARTPDAPAPLRRARRKQRVRVASGVVWIVAVAVLLTGVVALNVAVLRLNVHIDELGHRRADLQARNAALESRISRASARTESLARAEGLVPANPDETVFCDLASREPCGK
jgi:hypothetical protein